MTHTPSIRSANWLYLVSMVLILSLGTFLQKTSFQWGLLGTEFLLILLPTLLFLHFNRLSLSETLSLRWPGWGLILLGFMAGVGLWVMDVTIDGIIAYITGYTASTLPETYPTTMGAAILSWIALAIAPPICEEIQFRGYIQKAYEIRGRRIGVIIPSLMFTFYHFRLHGLVALLPIAFALGYMRMRSRSLWPGVAAHFANNTLAGVLLVTAGMYPDQLSKLPIASPAAFPVGLSLIVISLVGIAKITQKEDHQNPEVIPTPAQTVRRAWPVRWLTGPTLPLLIAGLFYLSVARLEYVSTYGISKFPSEPLRLNAPSQTQTTHLRYEIWNAANERVGQTQCKLSPVASNVGLDCQTNIKAFKVELPGSFFQSGNYNVHFIFEWAGDDLSLLNGKTTAMHDGSLQETTLILSEGTGQVTVKDSDGEQQFILPEDALMPDEWAWRLMALPFELGLIQKAQYVYPSFWDDTNQTNHPTSQEIAIFITSSEPLAIPAGNFIAWRVRVGNWTVWYDVKAPHTLLKYDAGFATYLLTDISEETTR